GIPRAVATPGRDWKRFAGLLTDFRGVANPARPSISFISHERSECKRDSAQPLLNGDSMKYRMSRLAPALVIAVASSGFVFAQGQRGAQPATVAASARSSAPVDLTGYWVSIVSEDWRIRMITPQKGDYPGIPINAAARRIADAWDPAKDEAAGTQCKG